MSNVSAYERSRMPTRIKRKLADIVAWMPGKRTLNKDALSATAKKQANRRLFSVCQRAIAYGSNGRPPANCVKMKAVAGHPKKTPGFPGMLQNRFQLAGVVATEPRAESD